MKYSIKVVGSGSHYRDVDARSMESAVRKHLGLVRVRFELWPDIGVNGIYSVVRRERGVYRLLDRVAIFPYSIEVGKRPV